MTETTATETITAPAEKQFGIDVRETIATYNKETDAAEEAARAARNQVADKYSAVTGGMRDLLGFSHTADALVELFDALTADQRHEEYTKIDRIRNEAYTEARKKRDQVLNKDALATFVATTLTEYYGSDYAEALFDAMPLTFTSLKELANSQGWCADFEQMARRATEEGALPADTVEVRRPVDWTEVPFSHGAQEGETWERIVTLPAYVRTVDPYGGVRSFYSLRRYIAENRYEKVADAPAGQTDTSA